VKVQKTPRGFEFIKFEDSRSRPCSMQQSSTTAFERGPGEDFLWLGLDDVQTDPVTHETFARMHLDVDQAKEIAAHLLRWIETGSLRKRRMRKPKGGA